MTSRRALLTFLFVTSLFSNAKGEESDVVYLAASKGKEIESKEGEKVIVHGVSKGSEKSASGTNYVHFENTDFHLVTFASDLDQFENGEPYEIYNEKRLAIDGVISIYKGKPQIKLTSPNQIQILTDDEVFPPVKAETKEPLKAVPEEMEEAAVPATEPPAEATKPKPPVDSKLYFK